MKTPYDEVLRSRLPRTVAAARPRRAGKVASVLGNAIEVVGVPGAIGDAVAIETDAGRLWAEVVALNGEGLTCFPLGEPRGLRAGSPVVPRGGPLWAPVSAGLLGRVLDGLGKPIDGLGPLPEPVRLPIDAAPPHPLRRGLVEQRLALGVRVLDAFVPCGRGQRLGIFAGSGVGKSSLLSMIARSSDAEVAVIALVGERGREVAEFIERDLGEAGLARSVVVVATSDAPAMVRIRAAFLATAIAEWFRDQGNDVLLLMDSLTRLAMAQREVGLAAGEPPTTKGYPPSMFSLLPKLLERAGLAERGSITGLYTVLVEGDDFNEPVADTARSILDGHITLSRSLAEAGHFPAVDVLASISRVAPAICAPDELAAALRLRQLLASWRDARDLIEMDAYVKGSNPVVDQAIATKPSIDAFCRQGLDERAPIDATLARLVALAGMGQDRNPPEGARP